MSHLTTYIYLMPGIDYQTLINPYLFHAGNRPSDIKQPILISHAWNRLLDTKQPLFISCLEQTIRH